MDKEGIYVNQKTFNDLSKNTTELINVLNHRMTKIEIQIDWIKKIGYYMAGVITLVACKILII